jgi:hypothetical protein
MLIVMGVFNAKAGKETYQKHVAGKNTIHDSVNENGRMLGQFATRNSMLIKSTVYTHKRIHLGIWKIPGTICMYIVGEDLIRSRTATISDLLCFTWD